MTYSYSRTVEESNIYREAKELGIVKPIGSIRHGMSGYNYEFIFNSEEDLILYRLAGSIKENSLIKFTVEKEK